MACSGFSFGRSVTSSALVLLILLQAVLVWERGFMAPAPVKKNDILAGTEFLSVFINGAMAPRPTRKRLSLRRGNTVIADNVPAESKNDEANIFRISRAPITIKPTVARPRTITTIPDDSMQYYPISRKLLDNKHHSLETIIDDLHRPGNISSKFIAKQDVLRKPNNNNKSPIRIVKPINQKVIGVSVTSSVAATPYIVRVEHNDQNGIPMITQSSPVVTSTIYVTPNPPLAKDVTSSPARIVTEELSNIVSESNRSEFSVDESVPRTSTHNRAYTTPRPTASYHSNSRDNNQPTDSAVSGSNSEPVEQRYEFQEHNSEMKEINHEIAEVHAPFLRNQGRKVGRHFEDSTYNQPSEIHNTKLEGKGYENQKSKAFEEQAKIYSEPAKVYGEPEKVYSEPSKVYSEPAKIYGEPSKIYSEPSKIYSEPAKVYGKQEKVYSEPARVYSEPAKVYSEPAKIYGEPARVYDINGHPIGEPDEKNYEVDEAVSVGSNGNVHGPQSMTEATNIDEDGHKVGYVVEGRNYRKYRVEERTSDGFIVGEYGVVSHDDGSLRGVRYTADGTINPRLIYDALMKFLAL
ncbi:uncharacterized protein LOC131674788 [Phymastichus coffea]|uniref:uncharacterized protein LOC131663185 n=1 Tax=Phymastichus coffea TaxID=108790 RepID=UPI00273CD60D|nr:uncharacterized protein LOC131663185 [Phymastichus coffea]XP_058809597.1 uncharacterized protein LOC131674788 [Phymastichus coffea]